MWLSANHYLEKAPLSPARQEDRVPSSSRPMTGAQQWEKKSAQSSATTELPGNTLKCPFRVIRRHSDVSEMSALPPKADIVVGSGIAAKSSHVIIRSPCRRARARTATRRGQAPSLLQVNGLIVPGLIELCTPHLVHALMLGFAEGHGRPEPNVEVAEIFESFYQSFGVELRAISF